MSGLGPIIARAFGALPKMRALGEGTVTVPC